MKPLLRLRHLFVFTFLFISFLLFSSPNDGSIGNPYTVLEAIQMQDSGSFWVYGYIAGCVKTNGGSITNTYIKTNLALGSDPTGTIHVSIQLSDNEVRANLNLVDHPDNRGQKVLIYGSLKKYCGIAGVINTSDYQLVSGTYIVVSPSPLKLIKNAPGRFYVTGVGLTDSIIISSDNCNFIPSGLPPNSLNAEVVVVSRHLGNSCVSLTSGSVCEQMDISCIPQSNDASLQSLKIGREVIKLTSSSVYDAKPISFDSVNVSVFAIPSDPNASIYEIAGNKELNTGENTIRIRVEAQDGTNRIYRIYLTRKCDPPGIVQQSDSMISACEGSDYTLGIKALGDGLSYQWFFQDDSISGATVRELKLRKINPEKDYGHYFVKVNGACGSLESRRMRFWVADSLPRQLMMDAPYAVYPGSHYKVTVGYEYGYNDVTNYKWSYSKNNIYFDSGIESNSPITYIFVDGNSTSGTLRAELTHVCGKRSVSKSVKVVTPTGITDLNIDPIRIYPNPAVEELIIENGKEEIGKIIIMNTKGQLFYSGKSASACLKLSIINWPAGVYIIVVHSAEGLSEYKILKM